MALPRPAAGIAAQDTYPWLLQAAWQRRAGAGALLIPSCRRGLTIPDALQVMPALPPADGLLLHLGIVDCAPRSLSRHDAASVAALHGQACADALVALARMHRRALEADRRRSVYVPLTRFGRALRRLLREAKARFGFVALVGIVRPSDGDAPAANTPLTDNIEEYNALSRRLARAEGARFLDLDHAIWSRPGAAGCFADDGYHFNRLGHLRCAELLMATLFEPAEPMARPSSASVRGLPPERR